MLRAICGTWRVLVVGAGALNLAGGVAPQTTQMKETVPAGPATVKTIHVKGELVPKGSNWLIAKDATDHYRIYDVAAGTKFIVDGVPKTLGLLQTGTKLTAAATTTEPSLVNRTTTITRGTVFWASPRSIIVTLEGGENKQYEVPSGFKFDVEGKRLDAMELRPGMKLVGTKVVEEPVTSISQKVVVTGVAPK